ncbi:MAG: hypothetical protein HY814_08605 [Candidatus Riflebacteria bacterium]|nr:hypothetical protein [Candidatus Riflebacteria bacterium]
MQSKRLVPWLVMVGVFLAIPVLGTFEVSAAGGKIPKRYLMPIWFTGKLEPKLEGERLLVKGRLQPDLAPMRRAKVTLDASKGFRVKSARFSAGTTATSDVFNGDLLPGQVLTVDGVVEREADAKGCFITLGFQFDFPTEELLSYVKQHSADQYPDADLRALLERTISEQHRGRRSRAITEVIAFPTGGAR